MILGRNRLEMGCVFGGGGVGEDFCQVMVFFYGGLIMTIFHHCFHDGFETDPAHHISEATGYISTGCTVASVMRHKLKLISLHCLSSDSLIFTC